MNLDRFHALTVGRIVEDGQARTLAVHDLGLLQLPSGTLKACDPFVTLGGHGVVIEGLEPGAYSVRVTIADVSDDQDGSHLREAYLSLVLAEGAPVSVENLPDIGVAVDAGTVGFADAEAVKRCMPEGNWYEDLFEPTEDPEGTSWFALMDSPDHLLEGCANIVMPLAVSGENVILCHSGWGDGVYPIARTMDAVGRTLGLHIDLLVVGGRDDFIRSEDEAAKVGFFKRLFGSLSRNRQIRRPGASGGV